MDPPADDLPELNGVSVTPPSVPPVDRGWRRWAGWLAGRRESLARPVPPLTVLYTPAAPPGPDRDERLLALCRGDTAVYDRLIAHEWQRHPGQSREELVELAVRLFRRDRE